MDYYFDSRDKFYLSTNYIGEGSEGVCYKKGNVVFKLFHDFYEFSTDPIELLKFKNVKIDTYYFYKGKIIINNEFKGFTMNYALGSCIDKSISKESFTNLIKAASKFQLDTKLLCDLNIQANDLFFVNILYDKINKKFNIVDCGDYKYCDTDSKILYTDTIQRLSDNLTRCLFENGAMTYIKKSKILNELMKIEFDPSSKIGVSASLNYDVTPVELLKIIKNELSNMALQDIESINESFNVLRKKR